MTDFDPAPLFRRLHEEGVRYVVIGGWAVNAHGHRRFTGDLDICPDPAPDNLSRLAQALRVLNADLHRPEVLERTDLDRYPKHLGLKDFQALLTTIGPTDSSSR